MMPRYGGEARCKTLAELAAAYKAGEVQNADGTVPSLVLDNDCSFVNADLTYEDDGDQDEYETIFESDSPADCSGGILEQALDLLGIPHRQC